MSARTIQDHWVYVVRECMTGCIKVGKSAKETGIRERVKSLQTGCPYELEIVAVLGPSEHPGERAIHLRLAKWRVRESGEWFYGVDDAYSAIGIRRPASVGIHQDVLNQSFRDRDEELRAGFALCRSDLANLRKSRENMRKREEALVKREKDSYLRWRRQIAIELARPSKWGPPKLDRTYWDLGDYVMDYDLLRMIVQEATWNRNTGAEFRRFIADQAGWADTRGIWGNIIGEKLRRHLEFLADHDPENYAEVVQMLRLLRMPVGMRFDQEMVAA